MTLFFIVLLLSVALIALSLVGLGVRIFFSKHQSFAETSIGKTKALRDKKIYCMKTEQKIIDKQINAGILNGGSCGACS